MKVIIAPNYLEMSRSAANLIAAQVIMKHDSVVGLATGTTPLGIYDRLAEMNKRGDIDFSKVITVNLDEYCGLPGDHPQSYRYFMNLHLFDRVNIQKSNTHLPNGMAEDKEAECSRYDRLIAELGGIDLQLLGIGHNGHIGFNEPDEAFHPDTNIVKLTEKTIQANSRLFEKASDVPRFAITMGIRSILCAKKILLAVNGADKAGILKQALTGPVTPLVPASILQLHPDVTVVADEEAARLLQSKS